MKKLFFLLIFLSSCSKITPSQNYIDDFNLEKISFNEFSNRLKIYVNNNPFPDIEK